MKFKDRHDAGRQLAVRLNTHMGKSDVLVLALPRGGVPVAAEIATALNAPLDVFLMRKLGVPGQETLTMGMITTGGTRILYDEVVSYLGISEETIETVARHERYELECHEKLYRGNRPAPDVQGKTVILVDDGSATGATMQAALTALYRQHPAHLIVAAPSIARTTREAIERLPDEIVCLSAQSHPFSLPDGIWYEESRQPTDIEASNLLFDLFRSSLRPGNSCAAEISSAIAKISVNAINAIKGA